MSVISRLPGRVVLEVGGEDRLRFLNGLLSCEVGHLTPGDLRYGALLTPQGKIIGDTMVHGGTDRVVLDVAQECADEIERRLALYRLRAAVTLSRTDEVVTVGGTGAIDPRADGIGSRAIAPDAEEDAAVLAAYRAARITRAVADMPDDFAPNEAFPHDVNMDLTGGVDFTKGCFVGQEVVSRMRHRGTARRRTVIVIAEEPLPPSGTPVTVDDHAVGRLGSTLGAQGLALVRIDRAGTHALAGTVPVRLEMPPGAPFALGPAAPERPEGSGDGGRARS